MKKLFLSAAALLLCLSAFSQTAELSVIGRLEGNHCESEPGIVTPGLNWGNSSLYTLFEGSFSEKFSFTLLNYWLNSTPKDLYSATLHSDMGNWLQNCYITFSDKGFSASAGKMCMFFGGFENDDYDFDVDYDLASSQWNGMQVYQWGLSVGYTLPSEMSTFSLQAVTSPFGERPFSSGLYSFGFEWRGDLGFYHSIWSAGLIGSEKGKFDKTFTLGNKFDIGEKVAVGADYTFYNGYCIHSLINGLEEEQIEGNSYNGHTILGTIDVNPGEKWEILAKGGYEKSSLADAGWYAGGVLRFYPLNDSRALRIHAAGAYRSLTGYSFTIGATLNLSIFSTK